MSENFQTLVLSRRSFLITSGTLGIGIAFGALPKRALGSLGVTRPVNAWVTMDEGGLTTIMSPASEMGQGIMTSLPMLIAEELDADWRKVRIVQSPDDARIFGNPVWGNTLTTFGSGSIRGYWDKARLAGAQARKVILWNAAEQLTVPMSELATEPGMVVHAASGRKLSYAEVIKRSRVPEPVPEATRADLKPTSQYRIIGKDLPRVDVPLKVNGAAKFGIDTQLPRMLHAAVLRPPVQGERPVGIDDAAAKAMPGIVKIVPLPWGVGVIGETVEGTQKAKRALKVTWSSNSPARKYSTAQVAQDNMAIARDLGQKGVDILKEGDAAAAIAGAVQVVTAEFIVDHVSHVTMEPLNATAVVEGNRAELWCSNQSPSNMKFKCAGALKTSPDNIKVNTPFLGGGYGLRSEGYEAVDAVLLAREVPGRPVKVMRTREEDMQNDLFRPLAAQRIEVGLDASGRIVGWRHRIVSESVFARSFPGQYEKLQGKDIVATVGHEFKYPVPAQHVQYVRAERGVNVGAWRGIANGYTKFAIESVIDELASLKGTDPVAYRLALLKNEPRPTKVIETVAQMAEWSRMRRNGRALGFAYSDAHCPIALAAEVSVNRQTGEIKVHQVWTAVDPGVAVQPKNIVAQIEGSVIFGLGAALVEQINIENGEVKETNLHQYRVLRQADIPPIEVQVISTDNPALGIGETGVPPVAPAISNAVARLTGKRLRHLPMLPERVKAALA